MELTFLENDGKWIAEFKVDKEFNLHIERANGTGSIKMYQNSATGGKYAIVEDFAINNNYKPVLDFSSGYFVGEKSVKIVSEVEPTYAAITTDGDVVEIKAQEKSVELTANGTTEVTPDSGFAYLSKVSVKTNVPQSGEGGGGTKIEYFRIDWDKAVELGYKPLRDSDSLDSYMSVGSDSSAMFSAIASAQFAYLSKAGITLIIPIGSYIGMIAQLKSMLDFSDFTKIGFTPYIGFVGSEEIDGKPTPIIGEVTFETLIKGNMYEECFIPITEEEFYNTAV